MKALKDQRHNQHEHGTGVLVFLSSHRAGMDLTWIKTSEISLWCARIRNT